MIERWFVTGTDTDVGKTLASCALLQAATRAGYRCAGYKPVASGSEQTPAGLRNGDALLLQASGSVRLDYDEVNPLAFAEATSPHIASAAEGRPVSLARLSDGLRRIERRADWIVVEGAGGWFTPLSGRETLADWVAAERLPVILVVGMKLGCINHALLTAAAIAQAGLTLGGWIANAVVAPGRRQAEYLATLRQSLNAPLLGEIPHLPAGRRQDLAAYLDLAPLAPR
ncbi:ATP-dependent dethiobiotin synthetase BioD [Affinibrenneria salicis]|uniref:ATP-dependent dethiobiotin synthetase BioD n=1 Tax=Affinibrenneria salicis TaxID=2590031 RepID=A0A5J5G3H2_9GAMM|nr:dethiobiotin synthase [Affinibrenneria salicis]KAA9000583.1 ATP-dependent dethiobiotin synthetase BioD [Affinibrenneria salicis]